MEEYKHSSDAMAEWLEHSQDDGIFAKRVKNYVWNGSGWERQSSTSGGAGIATVTVLGLPTVSISALPTISVGNVVSVSGLPTVSIGNNVGVSSLPTVSVTGLPTVSISALPSVTGTVGISSLPTVSVGNVISVSGLPTVSVSALPTVSVGNNLNIGSLPTVSVAALPSVSGTVTANLSATDNAVLDQIELNTDFGTVTGGGTETGAVRVTIANNSTGVLSVDDNGNSLTVDGTVTANLSATDNAVLDNIDANTTPTTGLNTGRKVVTTAGTAVALASSTTCKWVQITAETDNTDLIVVGDSGVIASLSTREGTPLDAGDTLTIPIDNLADVYIDSLVNGEGVTFLYGT